MTSKILVIEDNPEIRESLTEILENAGFEIFTSADGISGLQLAKKILPDLILCDIMMPGIDGIEVFRRLCSDEKLKPVPFIFLTAKSDLPDIRKGMQLGADDYITKPFRASDLVASINSRLVRINGFRHASPSRRTDETAERFSYDQKIFISETNDKRFVSVSDIVAITADSDYTNVFLADGSKIYVRKLLGHWISLLPVHKFFRIHRSTIINIEYVEKVDTWFHRSLKLTMKYLNQPLIASERASVLLKKELGI